MWYALPWTDSFPPVLFCPLLNIIKVLLCFWTQERNGCESISAFSLPCLLVYNYWWMLLRSALVLTLSKPMFHGSSQSRDPNVTSVVSDNRGMAESSAISQCSGHSMNFQTFCKTRKETKSRGNFQSLITSGTWTWTCTHTWCYGQILWKDMSRNVMKVGEDLVLTAWSLFTSYSQLTFQFQESYFPLLCI